MYKDEFFLLYVWMDCFRLVIKYVKFLKFFEFSGKENILLIVLMVCFLNDMFGYVEGNV